MRSDDGAFLGIDIGGQSIKGVRLERDGTVSARETRVTPAREGAVAVLSALGDLAAALARQGPVAAIGAGTPGGVDADGTIVGDAANIPGWAGTNLHDAFGAIGAIGAAGSPVPLRVRNDGNLAAYAEWTARSGASECLLFVGLGTGIGGGYVERGNLLSGMHDMAVEIGHVVAFPGGRSCACGIRGCGEAYASGPSIARLAEEMAADFDTGLSREIGAWKAAGRAADAAMVYRAFAAGDALARAVDGIAAEALARVCASAIAMLAPDCVVLGGGVMRGAGHLVAEVAAKTRTMVYASAWEGTRFEAACCGHEAGLLGAALFGAAAVAGPEDLFRLAGRLFGPNRAVPCPAEANSALP